MTVQVAVSCPTGFCLTAMHAELAGETWYLDSLTTTPSTVDCTATTY